MSSNRNSNDYVGESFDDAPEHPENLNVKIPQSSSTRSLTDSPPIGTAPSPDATEKPPLPTASQDEQQDDGTDGGETKSAKKNKKKNKKKKGKNQDEVEEQDNDTVEDGPGDAVEDTVDFETVGEAKGGDNQDQKDEQAQLDGPLETEELGDGDRTPGDESVAPNITTPDITRQSPPVPAKDDVASPPSGGLMGLSGALPSLPWGPPPVNKNPPPPAPPPAPTRKPSGPFAWFSRSSTGTKDIKSPQSTSRRNTANSVSTLASNLDRSHDGEDGDSSSVNSKKPRRNSLKDQFKLLRMREEVHAHGHENDDGSVRSGHASISHAGASPPIIPEEGEEGILAAPALAPGATSPAGLSRRSAPPMTPLRLSEELNAAIKRGIPQTIRGVIWQILSDCRTGELDDIYRELVARGTDKDRRTPDLLINGTTETSSSRSSIRSNNSGSATQPTSTTPSPSQEMDPERLAKEQAASESARAKKAKDEAAALQKLEKTIRRDLGARTSYSKYFISQGSQESLYGLCKAYALYDEAVGYAQGMNFIVMPLLFNNDEVDAFELLVKLMNKYGLREMFIADMPGLHRSLYQFERLLEDLEPALYCHLRRRGVPPQLYATQWFLTLFAYRFPLQLVLRIYDLIFEEGLENTIVKFAVAIMRRNTETLLGMKDMAALTTFLKERIFDVYIDKQPSASSILESGFFGSSGAADKGIYRSDILVQDACDIPLTKEMLNSYTAEWEEKTRTEKEREVELEHLRHTTATQSSRIRLLEERAEASDKEHVQLASELVHAKVENEELRDLTEALNLQVSELKNVVDKQPAEVEEKLRLEMERIMQRNIEVQNENRSMEENMADMEKELVATKMKWAEMSENHETLKQKWSDLRRALD
ncbi:hypothetical protein N7509_000773 [Penicillium cosmopolitanum]|uniref:GTPase-activating protein GYP5 n=1 Tax=Penicillium cosmopolitanum TaxID=1131564 RepID=A0A9W9WB75_9EURO|nr:uncharacterized protein N7509_000773 [Penicillium cosmopolitanum]KAJ5414146.1 hypothetical protein N7509_000773 [Penicillium cosmopolitanum]